MACSDRKEGSSGRGGAKDRPRESHGTCGTCGDSTCSAAEQRAGESDADFEDRRKLQSRLSRIEHKVIVLSGKGGVGKSTVAVNLAAALARAGKRVGLLDADIHGPSVPVMLGLEGRTVEGDEQGLLPVETAGLKVMSIGFLLRSQDDAVIWRGPMKYGVIKQLLRDVLWGDLDYLIVDSPPGTGDEPLAVCQLIGALDGAIVVTTPQRVAAVDVRKSITFCRQVGVPILGIVENMSGFVCPKCGEVTPILRSGGGRQIADDMHVPFLGSIPIDPQVAEACDRGGASEESSAAEVVREIARRISSPGRQSAPAQSGAGTKDKESKPMKIAIPLANGRLSAHFGHCERFALVDVDPAAKTIVKREDLDAPPHEPGLLPPWLAQRGVTMIIAGGMGQRARGMFADQGIEVLVGAPAETPERLVGDYFAGTLRLGDNVCDH